MRLTTRFVLVALTIVGGLAAFLVVRADSRAHASVVSEEVRRLEAEGRLIAGTWARGGVLPTELAHTAAAALQVHVVLLSRDGSRLADSEFLPGAPLDPERLSNRPEVADALAGQPASVERADRSDGVSRVYVAVPAASGAVRLDRPTTDMTRALDRTRAELLAVGVAATLLAGILALLFAQRIVGPINSLRDVARALAGGDLARRPGLAATGELGELSNAMHRLAEALSSRVSAHAAEDALVNATLEALHEGVVAVDPKGDVARINETARRLLGVRDAAPFNAERLPRDRPLRDALTAALAGVPTELVETTLGERTLALAARPLAPGGAVLAVLDLTAQRRLETIRRDFVANVSHELKTPLTVVSGFADTLLDPDLSATMRRQFAETIRAHAQRMQRIVDDLLDLSRIESGGWIPNPGDLDLATLALDATAVAAASADGRGVTLAFEIAEGATRVWADATAMRQVLSNLADNAVRHTASGRITVFAVPQDGGVEVGVRDTGVGIPAEHLPRIFERVYRVDPGRSREQGGTGLGLAIVRHLVEAHGGRVSAESVLGQGTTIQCWFPPPPTGVRDAFVTIP